MKPQDIVFLLSLLPLLYLRNTRITTILGLSAILLAMPLFMLQVFFTAQRLTWYAAGYFLLAVLFSLISMRKSTS